MISKRTLGIATALALMAGGVAIAASQEGGLDEVSERKIALDQVPQAAMQGARAQLVSVTKAELVTLKDGRTVYELKGKNQAGKTLELYVSADGQILGTED
jgi:uncharacterized membrane protein YkoI